MPNSFVIFWDSDYLDKLPLVGLPFDGEKLSGVSINCFQSKNFTPLSGVTGSSTPNNLLLFLADAVFGRGSAFSTSWDNEIEKMSGGKVVFETRGILLLKGRVWF